MDKKNSKQAIRTRTQKPLPVPDEIHPARLYRLNQIIPHFIPISKSSWYAGIKSGKYPAPEHLGPRTSVWRGSELLPVIGG